MQQIEASRTQAPPAEALVALDHVSRRFGDVVAVDDLSLDLHGGEILGLYGPSGSGKTTTIRMILGVHMPTAGRVSILGVPSHRISGRQREQIGYAPQRFLYPPTLSAEEVVGFAAGIYGLGPIHGPRQIRYVLEQVDLWNKRRYHVATMSGGERRRVANAAALVHNPRLIFMDEPTSGLDPILRTRMWDWFRALRDEGRTLLITGHYLAEAELCDRLALLVNGKLSALGSPIDLRRQALGGDIIEVEVAGSLAAAVDALNRLAVVKRAQVRGRDTVWATVDEAGPALPAIVDGLRRSNVEVRSATDIRPPFDDIFEQLVGQAVSNQAE